MKIKYILSLLIFKLISSVSMTNSLDSDRMYIFFEERVFEIHLIENDITNELISILPLKTKIMEENTNMDNHKYTIPLWADIEVSTFILEQEHNKYIKVEKGDLFLFKRKELILFDKEDFFLDEDKNYIKIGRLNDIDEFLNSIKRDNKIFLWNSLNYKNQNEKIKPNVYYTSIMNYLTLKIFTVFCFIFL